MIDICANCEYFVQNNKCKEVIGHIEAKGWCNLFEEGKANVEGTPINPKHTKAETEYHDDYIAISENDWQKQQKYVQTDGYGEGQDVTNDKKIPKKQVKSADAEIFWQAIGKKGRHMYIRTSGEDAKYEDYQWQDMPKAVRQSIAKEMNQHYRKPSLPAGSWRHTEEDFVQQKGGVVHTVGDSLPPPTYDRLGREEKVGCPKCFFEGSHKQVEMHARDVHGLELRKILPLIAGVAAAGARVAVGVGARIATQAVRAGVAEGGKKIGDKITGNDEEEQKIKDVGRAYFTAEDLALELDMEIDMVKEILEEFVKDDILIHDLDGYLMKYINKIELKKIGPLAALLMGAAAGFGGYIAGKKILEQLMTGGVNPADAFRIVAGTKQASTGEKTIVHNDGLISFICQSASNVNSDMPNNLNLAKDAYYDDVSVLQVGEQVTYAGGDAMIVSITANYATLLKEDGSKEMAHIKGIMRKADIIYTSKYGMSTWDGTNVTVRQEILEKTGLPQQYTNMDWNMMPHNARDIIQANYGTPIRKQEFTCPECHDKFDDKAEYEDHQQAHKKKMTAEEVRVGRATAEEEEDRPKKKEHKRGLSIRDILVEVDPKTGEHKRIKQYGMAHDYDKEEEPKMRTPKPHEPVIDKDMQYTCSVHHNTFSSWEQAESHAKNMKEDPAKVIEVKKAVDACTLCGNPKKDHDEGYNNHTFRPQKEDKKKRQITKPIGKYKNWDACKADGKSDAYCGYLEHNAKSAYQSHEDVQPSDLKNAPIKKPMKNYRDDEEKERERVSHGKVSNRQYYSQETLEAGKAGEGDSYVNPTRSDNSNTKKPKQQTPSIDTFSGQTINQKQIRHDDKNNKDRKTGENVHLQKAGTVRDGSDAGDAGNRDNSHQQGSGQDYASNVKQRKKSKCQICGKDLGDVTVKEYQSHVIKEHQSNKDSNMTSDTDGVNNPVFNGVKDRTPKGHEYKVGIMEPVQHLGIYPVYKEEIDVSDVAHEYYADPQEPPRQPEGITPPDATPVKPQVDKPPKMKKPQTPEGAYTGAV